MHGERDGYADPQAAPRLDGLAGCQRVRRGPLVHDPRAAFVAAEAGLGRTHAPGSTTTEEAYDEAVTSLSEALDALEARLDAGGPYLFGRRITETDVRLFVTLIRFDVADHGVVTANLRRVSDYPLLSQSMRRRHERDDIVPTVNPGPIKRGYDAIEAPNPTRIVPKGPAVILGGVRPGD